MNLVKIGKIYFDADKIVSALTSTRDNQTRIQLNLGTEFDKQFFIEFLGKDALSVADYLDSRALNLNPKR